MKPEPADRLIQIGFYGLLIGPFIFAILPIFI